jgi:GNAT superfamily N-acetyltransferase
MLATKVMKKEDFQFAAELANTMDWQMKPEDFQFMTQLEPEGSFVVLDNSKPVGIATSISYGKAGWFGNLIVKEEYRHKGVGTLLVNHAVNYLQRKGVETIGLYAYPHLKQFYSNLGFKSNEDFTVLHTQLKQTPRQKELSKITKIDIPAIVEFDKKCFGGDRTNLLESIISETHNHGYKITNNDRIIGFVASTVYESAAWIGPLVCRQNDFDTAILLAREVLAKLGNKDVYAVLPKASSPLLDDFLGFGFKEWFFVSRMFLGKAVKNCCVHLAESLERG